MHRVRRCSTTRRFRSPGPSNAGLALCRTGSVEAFHHQSNRAHRVGCTQSNEPGLIPGLGEKQQEDRPMNRPDPTEHEYRTEVMQTRVTLAERAHVQEMAQRAGLTVSEYLRRRACSYQVPTGPRRRALSPELATALNRVGVNINQIALRLNCDRPERISIEETMGELQRVLALVVSGMDDAESEAAVGGG